MQLIRLFLTRDEGEAVTPRHAVPGGEEAEEEDGHAHQERESGDERVGVGDAVADALRDVRAEGHAQQAGDAHDDAELVGDAGLDDLVAAGLVAAGGLGAVEGELGAPPHERAWKVQGERFGK